MCVSRFVRYRKERRELNYARWNFLPRLSGIDSIPGYLHKQIIESIISCYHVFRRKKTTFFEKITHGWFKKGIYLLVNYISNTTLFSWYSHLNTFVSPILMTFMIAEVAFYNTTNLIIGQGIIHAIGLVQSAYNRCVHTCIVQLG